VAVIAGLIKLPQVDSGQMLVITILENEGYFIVLFLKTDAGKIPHVKYLEMEDLHLKKGNKMSKIKEEIKNCFKCSHFNVCIKYKNGIDDLLTTKKTFEEIALEIAKNCSHFEYKKFETYQLKDFKDMLKMKIENINDAKLLLALYQIIKTIEGDI
jgi:hypothetical protein